MYVGKLRAQLIFTIFIMFLLPFIFVFALFYINSEIYDVTYKTQDYLIIFGIAGAFAGFQLLLLYFIGPASIERHYGGQIQWISSDYDGRLWEMIASRARQAGVALVKIGVLQTDEINAFVYGYGKKKGKLVLTQGLLKHLDFDEVEGVVGHELGHVRHRDMSITLMLIAVPTLIWGIYHFSRYSTRRQRNRNNLWLIIVIMILFFATYIGSILLIKYVSRIREYYADAHSVELLKDPRPIVQGLAKLTYKNAITEDAIIKTRTQTHALMIVSPMASAHQADEARKTITKVKVDLDRYGDIGGADIDEEKLEEAMEKELKGGENLMRTHPLTAKRILGALKYAEELELV
ncbi:MAG: M48 family metalloprotease [Candidatus Helarchaeota archaeon]|nr:M48 family metalloprotease [Candidatus Helarchaeota archaeon]